MSKIILYKSVNFLTPTIPQMNDNILGISPFVVGVLTTRDFTLQTSLCLHSCCAQIYIWQFKNKEINAVAFIDTDVYIHTVSVLKNFILIADIMKNVKLLRFKVT